ncbi:MAG: succinate dehydrogenase, hydrophobic membrane anchor protein [Alphaproteobacteria bacterium]|nr:succinate dehydrogenase, hydrophobic membrane anchor protein [Alphaproteobacteria bacterium]
MNEKTKSLRSPLGAAKGRGSAQSGFEHWYIERISALILLPTTAYVLIGFLDNVAKGGYSGAIYWLQSPLAAAFAILFLFAGLRHLVCGLQVVMEDYIHLTTARLPLLFAVKFGAVLLAILGVLSIAKIYFAV